MDRRPSILLMTALVMTVMGLLACSAETPVPQPKTVSKKIAVQPAATSTSAKQPNQNGATNAAPAVAPELPAVTATVSEHAAQPAPPSGDTKAATAQTSELIKESLQIASTYDPTGRFDPFDPLFKEQTAEVTTSVSKDAREKRKPQTPLERISLSQLKLTAIIRASSGNRALVEDATGKGYVIHKGTFIGLNAGRVINIVDDRVLIEEEIENLLGELTIQNAELKLQKPAGEL